MWEKVKFTDIVKDVTGGNTKLNQNKYLSIGKYPIIDQGEKFIGGYFDDDLTLKISKPVVVFGDHSRCIKYIDFDFILGADGVKVLEPLQNLDSKYLFYFLKTIKLPNVGYSRHFKFLKESIIPLPPLPIQEKIAEILDKADELRRKDKDLEAKYDELAQSIFIDMFGDPVRNEKGWEVNRLEEVCLKITDGTHHSPTNVAIGKKYITAKHIKNGKLNFFLNETYVSEEDHKTIFSRCNPEFGDVLYIKDGATTGMAAVNDLTEEFSMLSSLALFKLHKDIITSNFLVYYLNSSIVKENLIREYMAGAAIKRFTLQKIKNFSIIAPPIHLQEAFAKKIELINQLKAQTNAHKSEELFQSLLQKAFKGELVS